VAFVTRSIRSAVAAAGMGQLVRVCDCIGYAYGIACVRVSAHSNDAIAFQDSNVCATGPSKMSIILPPLCCIQCGLSVDDLPQLRSGFEF